ncbi:hypothetical protein [Methylobacterium planeticum]|uniref:Uncharacterized protein n=1 Tax=Methylobacterium planeticum TaxID=2615211 RepID=A0A6N6MM73_9HYPH|nr:hypothetical protein [Methylobacterium planeticum]KAB1071206.1 hypothetical protein F6X51_20145 [Methylobacterium planeticum]
MSDDTQAISDLRALRSAFVAKRRQIAQLAISEAGSSGASSPDVTSGYLYGADLEGIQKQIEAVDRAIADERVIERERQKDTAPGFGFRHKPQTDVA